MNTKLLGEHLRKIRVQKGYSAEAIGFQLKVSQSTISNIENGKTNIHLHRIIEYCKALDVDMFQVLSELLFSAEFEADISQSHPDHKEQNNSDIPLLLKQIAHLMRHQNELLLLLHSQLKNIKNVTS